MKFAVKGKTKIGRLLTIRKYENFDDAADHALSVNMAHWEDVWVEGIKQIARLSIDPPLPPFEVTDNYVIDAKHRKIASLLGTQEVKEAFASMLIGAFSHD